MGIQPQKKPPLKGVLQKGRGGGLGGEKQIRGVRPSVAPGKRDDEKKGKEVGTTRERGDPKSEGAKGSPKIKPFLLRGEKKRDQGKSPSLGEIKRH